MVVYICMCFGSGQKTWLSKRTGSAPKYRERAGGVRRVICLLSTDIYNINITAMNSKANTAFYIGDTKDTQSSSRPH